MNHQSLENEQRKNSADILCEIISAILSGTWVASIPTLDQDPSCGIQTLTFFNSLFKLQSFSDFSEFC